jgi:ribonuclease PH
VPLSLRTLRRVLGPELRRERQGTAEGKPFSAEGLLSLSVAKAGIADLVAKQKAIVAG